METIDLIKKDIRIDLLKKIIKEKSENQKFYKSQRKTVKLVGERKISPDEARWKHTNNRHSLRILYAAYGLLKGKKFSQIENFYPEENHPLNNFKNDIEKIINGLSEK